MGRKRGHWPKWRTERKAQGGDPDLPVSRRTCCHAKTPIRPSCARGWGRGIRSLLVSEFSHDLLTPHPWESHGVCEEICHLIEDRKQRERRTQGHAEPSRTHFSNRPLLQPGAHSLKVSRTSQNNSSSWGPHSQQEPEGLFIFKP